MTRPEVLVAWEHDRRLVTSLARGAVSRAAPDELEQFEVTAEALLTTPKRVRRAAERDEPLARISAQLVRGKVQAYS